MANYVICDLVSEICGGFFSIICDKYTDISNKKQLTICTRWVDEQLEAHQDFFGFYNIPDICVETIVSAVKDVLLKLQLPLANCRGQCYDGASNMLGHRTGVAKRIQDRQPKAYPTHCHGHSLSLSVKYTTKNCKLLSDTMDIAKEVVTLIQFSPKQENLLGEIKENLEEPESAAKGIVGLCPTDGQAVFSESWTIMQLFFRSG